MNRWLHWIAAIVLSLGLAFPALSQIPRPTNQGEANARHQMAMQEQWRRQQQEALLRSQQGLLLSQIGGLGAMFALLITIIAVARAKARHKAQEEANGKPPSSP
jgi:hypothetical protein